MKLSNIKKLRLFNGTWRESISEDLAWENEFLYSAREFERPPLWFGFVFQI